MNKRNKNSTANFMQRAFLMGNGITSPVDKSAALNTKYKDWWYFVGHRQHSGVLNVYEMD